MGVSNDLLSVSANRFAKLLNQNPITPNRNGEDSSKVSGNGMHFYGEEKER
jgi:hypothetical protein